MDKRFESKFRVNETTGCWEWQAGLRAGYGAYLHNGKPCYAHRVAYEMFVGPLQEGDVVRHKCNNKLCVNPDHLVKGGVIDNIQDRFPEKEIGINAKIEAALKSTKAYCDFRLTLDCLEFIKAVMEELDVDMSTAVNVIIDAASGNLGTFMIKHHYNNGFERQDGRKKVGE